MQTPSIPLAANSGMSNTKHTRAPPSPAWPVLLTYVRLAALPLGFLLVARCFFRGGPSPAAATAAAEAERWREAEVIRRAEEAERAGFADNFGCNEMSVDELEAVGNHTLGVPASM